MWKPLLVIGLPALFAGAYFGLSQSRWMPKLDRHVEARVLWLIPVVIVTLLLLLAVGAHLAGSERILAAFQRFLLWLHE